MNKLLLKSYDKPITNDLLIIIPFFNPVNSIRITQNLLFIYSKLSSSSIPFIIVHGLFPDSNKILIENENYQVFHTNSYGFIKENLCNLIIKKYLDKYQKFMILDADIIFSSTDWYDKVSNKLNSFDIIHPYQSIYFVDFNFEKKSELFFSKLYLFKNPQITSSNTCHGFTFAFTKEFFVKYGLPEEALLGGGDAIICQLLEPKKNNFYNKIYQPILEKYQNLTEIKINYGYLENEIIYHLYHNDLSNRQYGERYLILNQFLNSNQNLLDLIERNSEGIILWKNLKINEIILKYFKGRQDDKINFNSWFKFY